MIVISDDIDRTKYWYHTDNIRNFSFSIFLCPAYWLFFISPPQYFFLRLRGHYGEVMGLRNCPVWTDIERYIMLSCSIFQSMYHQYVLQWCLTINIMCVVHTHQLSLLLIFILWFSIFYVTALSFDSINSLAFLLFTITVSSLPPFPNSSLFLHPFLRFYFLFFIFYSPLHANHSLSPLFSYSLPLTVGHTGAVTGVSFDSRGVLLASCSADMSAKIWDLSTYTCIKTLKVSLNHCMIV